MAAERSITTAGSRITQEGFVVYLNDKVFEILQVYVNPEWCEYVPHETLVRLVPVGYKIWISSMYCKLKCNERNKKAKRNPPSF